MNARGVSIESGLPNDITAVSTVKVGLEFYDSF